MDTEKKERLAKKGWVSKSIQDFLSLTPKEMSDIELKSQLNREFKDDCDEEVFIKPDRATVNKD